MSDDKLGQCAHGYYGLCPHCYETLRAELAELRARVSGVPRTSEYYFAMRDAHLAHDSKAYFAARNDNLDTRENRQFFEAGFTRGFAAGEKVYAGTIASVPDDVAKLPQSFSDESVERISDAARKSYRRHMGNIRGQQITPLDDIENHIMNAALDECRAILAAKEKGQ